MNKKILFTMAILVFSISLFLFQAYSFTEDDNKVTANAIDCNTNSLSSGGVHHHPKLILEIFGEEIVIPNHLGFIGGSHLPVHTHEEGDGTIHWEIDIPMDINMKLGYFFDITWEKTFNSECILDYCNGDGGGEVKFFVNGERNYEYENYYIKEGDELRIVFD